LPAASNRRARIWGYRNRSSKPMSTLMQRFVQWVTNPVVRRTFNYVSIALVLIVGALVGRHFAQNGWPIHEADPALVGIASVLFLLSYGFKAFGWQRLFDRESRPKVLTLAAAGGAAAVGGIALPGRIDEVIRIAIVRRGHRVTIGTIALTLFVLGLIDTVALMPLAASSAALISTSALMTAGLSVVAFCGIGAAGVVVALPRLSGVRRLQRFRLVHWLSDHACCPLEAAKATALVGASWTLRALATFVLLHGLGISASFALAMGFLCAGAASAVLPIAPAGAATQAGAGAMLLTASGIPLEQAIAFGIAAQALVIASGAVFVVLFGGQLAGRRIRPMVVRAFA
jgi:uncharacterized membrane protein YbhN (UPF0104 family)